MRFEYYGQLQWLNAINVNKPAFYGILAHNMSQDVILLTSTTFNVVLRWVPY